jgi:hypothetical protein
MNETARELKMPYLSICLPSPDDVMKNFTRLPSIEVGTILKARANNEWVLFKIIDNYKTKPDNLYEYQFVCEPLPNSYGAHHKCIGTIWGTNQVWEKSTQIFFPV